MSALAITNASGPIDRPVATFQVVDRATGAPVTVDGRTYDPARHALEPVAAPAA